MEPGYRAKLIEAIEDFKGSIEFKSPLTHGLAFVVLPILLFSVIGLFSGDWNGFLWDRQSVIVSILLCYCIIVFGAHIGFYLYRIQLKKRLLESGLLEKLALGWDYLPDIYQYTPWPMKLFLYPKPDNYMSQVKLIARNLAWYLGRPRKFIPPLWIFDFVVILGFFLLLIIPFVVVTYFDAYSGIEQVLTSNTLHVTLILLIIYFRGVIKLFQNCGTEVLLSYVLDLVDADGE